MSGEESQKVGPALIVSSNFYPKCPCVVICGDSSGICPLSQHDNQHRGLLWPSGTSQTRGKSLGLLTCPLHKAGHRARELIRQTLFWQAALATVREPGLPARAVGLSPLALKTIWTGPCLPAGCKDVSVSDYNFLFCHQLHGCSELTLVLEVLADSQEWYQLSGCLPTCPHHFFL